MIDIFDEKAWKRILEQDSKLKHLAIDAGVENNPKMAKILREMFIMNCKRGITPSSPQEKLGKYLFCQRFYEDDYEILEMKNILERAVQRYEEFAEVDTLFCKK